MSRKLFVTILILTAAFIFRSALPTSAQNPITWLDYKSGDMENGAFIPPWDQTNASDGTLTIIDNNGSEVPVLTGGGGKLAKAHQYGNNIAGGHFSRTIWELPNWENQIFRTEAMFYLPTGFYSSMMGAVQLIGWDTNPTLGNQMRLAIYNNDKKARLFIQEDYVGRVITDNFPIPEGQWVKLTIEQKISQTEGWSKVYLNDNLMAQGSTDYCIGEAVNCQDTSTDYKVTRLRYGLVAIADQVQLQPVTVYFDEVKLQTGTETSGSPTPSPSATTTCYITDINKDGIVNLADRFILVSDFFSDADRSDFNSDNIVDITDYSTWTKDLGKTSNCSSTPSPSPLPSPTPPPTPNPTPQPTPTPSAPSTSTYLWLSPQEASLLPDSGAAWNKLLSDASNSVMSPDFTNQDSKNDVYIVAKALVWSKTGGSSYRTEVRDGLKKLVETHPVSSSSSWDWLGILRGLGSYVIAADTIDLKNFDPTFDQNTFRPWLTQVRSAITEGSRGSVISAQEDRPNNFGTHASASRISAALYLNDQQDLTQAIKVFRGWLGDRSQYADFNYGETSWQCDPQNPVGLNPACTKNGLSLDGVLPDDQRRCGTFVNPPCKTDYSWEGLQGAVVAAELLHRQGYPSYQWSNQALLRSFDWLYNTTFSDGNNFPATGDDIWMLWIINQRYNRTFPASSGVGAGKMVGYTDWTHQ